MAKKKTADAPDQKETVGYHKGALATLAKEREELQRILKVVEQLMHMHVSQLKEHGVDLQQQANEGKKE